MKSFFELIATGDSQTLKKWIEKTPQLVNTASRKTQTIQAIKFHEGDLPLFLAVAIRNFEIVKLLFQNGADPNLIISNGTNKGWNAFLKACFDRNELLVNYFLELPTKININQTTDLQVLHPQVGRVPFKNITPLGMASVVCDAEIAKILLNHGANIDVNYQANNQLELNPLSHVCDQGLADLAKTYLEHLLSNKNSFNTQQVSNLLSAALQRIIESKEAGDVQNRKTLIKLITGIGIDSNVEYNNKTPLLSAVIAKQAIYIEYLLNNIGMQDKEITKGTYAGFNAFALACHQNADECIEVFLRCPTTNLNQVITKLVTIPEKPSPILEKKTILILLAMQGNTKVILKIIQKIANPFIRLDNINTARSTVLQAAISFALHKKEMTLLKILVKYLKEKSNCSDVEKQELLTEALIYACTIGAKNCVEWLAETVDINATVSDRFDDTIQGVFPLFAAAINGHEEIVKLLLEKNASVDQQVSIGINQGKNALYVATFNHHPNIAALLLQHGADATKIVNYRDINIPLFYGIFIFDDLIDIYLKYKPEIFYFEKNREEFFSFLMETLEANKLNVITHIYQNLNSHSPFKNCLSAADKIFIIKYWISKKNLDTLKLLVSLGMTINNEEPAENEEGLTCLQLACIYNDSAIITFLIEQGANIRYQSKTGKFKDISALDILITQLLIKPEIFTAIEDQLQDKEHDIYTSLLKEEITSLFAAVSLGRLGFIDFLLARGFSPDEPQPPGKYADETPLIAAIASGNKDIIRLFFRYPGDWHALSKSSHYKDETPAGLLQKKFTASQDRLFISSATLLQQNKDIQKKPAIKNPLPKELKIKGNKNNLFLISINLNQNKFLLEQANEILSKLSKKIPANKDIKVISAAASIRSTLFLQFHLLRLSQIMLIYIRNCQDKNFLPEDLVNKMRNLFIRYYHHLTLNELREIAILICNYLPNIINAKIAASTTVRLGASHKALPNLNNFIAKLESMLNKFESNKTIDHNKEIDNTLEFFIFTAEEMQYQLQTDSIYNIHETYIIEEEYVFLVMLLIRIGESAKQLKLEKTATTDSFQQFIYLCQQVRNIYGHEILEHFDSSTPLLDPYDIMNLYAQGITIYKENQLTLEQTIIELAAPTYNSFN